MTDPPISGALSLLLPSPEQTLLLKAVLLPPSDGRHALLAWQAGERNPTAALARHPGGGRLLAPLLYKSLEPDFSGLEAPLLTYLKTAAIREELRAAEFRRILIAVLKRMEETGVPFLLLRGAALAETVYPDPRFRHSGEIGLLVRSEDLERAGSALAPIGFEPGMIVTEGTRRLSRHVHRSGLVLTLCHELYAIRLYNQPLDELWRRSVSVSIRFTPDGTAASARIFSPADQLWHLCAHASSGPQRENLLWACDACFLLAREPGLDWDLLVDRAAATHVSLPLHVLLRYVARDLEAPIPGRTLSRLAGRAGAEERLSAELALFGAAARPGPKIVPMLKRSGSWRERAFLVRWRFLPSPDALVSAGLIDVRKGAPLFYAARGLRLLARRVTAGGGGRITRTAGRSPSG